MVNIRLYDFRKRLNSTAIPSDSGATYEQGEIKSEFSLTGFSVKFAFSDPADVPGWNYAKVVELNRYYFITDWYYSGGFWSAQFAVDVLASNRADILASQQYVSRAFSDFDSALIDTAYPATGSAKHANSYLTPAQFWGADMSGNSGTIVLGVISADTSPIGAVSYYAMSMTTFGAFMAAMLSSINWAGISATEISENLQKALINPTQYIVSCRWYPLALSSFSTLPVVLGGIKLGWWTFSVTGTIYQLSTPGAGQIARQQELAIPKHPAAVGRRSYLQLSPYSTYMLKFPPFGCFELDSTELYDRDYLVIRVNANVLTGDCTLMCTAYSYGETVQPQNAFFYYTGQFGVPLVVGQIAGDIGNYKSALLAGGVAGVAALSEVL